MKAKLTETETFKILNVDTNTSDNIGIDYPVNSTIYFKISIKNTTYEKKSY